MSVCICVSLLYISVFIVGTIGNVLVVLVVFRTHEMRNTTNFFLVNLSVADLLVILVCMPSAFVDIFSKEVWYLGPVIPIRPRIISLIVDAMESVPEKQSSFKRLNSTKSCSQ